ncbi:MAG: hypothetical protein FJ387_01990, partial [Verrucomicrobia bacterium]|nr:hypothetical protein [Verrucomicrobiota bacterium]
MSPVNRRQFLQRSVLASAAAPLVASFEEQALLAGPAASASGAAATPVPAKEFPRGRLGPLQVSRLICGGNLISGFAHSRDLIYVSPLLKRYFTDEKVCETLAICEAQGLNTAI